MVLEISVSKEEENHPKDHHYEHVAYTVHVDDHRILTVATDCSRTLSQWLKNVLKSPCSNLKGGSGNGTILVGLSADRDGGHDESSYDLLSICVGSHCLIYHLPCRYDYSPNPAPKFLNRFFADRRVVVVGIGMAAVAGNLEKHHGVKIGKGVKDLHDAVGKDDARKYDLDGLAKAVVGKHVDVARAEHKVEWYMHHWYYYWKNRVPRWKTMSLEKIKFSTVDSYLCYLIGSELLQRRNVVVDVDVDVDVDVNVVEEKNDVGDSRAEKIKESKKKKKAFKNMKVKMNKGYVEHALLFYDDY
ncbi:Ribonuclease H-like domain containing protein [Parasponia andersonii]|uniref:Ribonuclease H-like domain containing protein n=1 Tax=Parasponia andersonii TaxID=3476 RepID=A0A2P5B309_PARAD|nr:Ribonuclease H-like domain containing protein [Parasponia andersonii]